MLERSNKYIIMFLSIGILLSYSAQAQAQPHSSSQEYLNELKSQGYSVEDFLRFDSMAKMRFKKRQEIEDFINISSQSNSITGHYLEEVNQDLKTNYQALQQEIALRGEQAKDAAKRGAPNFTYLPSTDGSKTYFTNGLATRIKDKPVNDEFGNTGREDMYNMIYQNRMLVRYEATTKDSLGNRSKKTWQGAYRPGSVSYANDDTTAYKNLSWYKETLVDHAGNEIKVYWKANKFQGKNVTEYTQEVTDSVYGTTTYIRSDIKGGGDKPTSYHEEGWGSDGLFYTLERNKITYQRSQIKGFLEEKTIYDEEGTQKEKRETEAEFFYRGAFRQYGEDASPAPGILDKSVITTTVSYNDLSARTETVTTLYDYAKGRLSNASAESQFSGKQSSWYHFSDAEGRRLQKETDEEGNITYYYIDAESLEPTAVAPKDVIVTLRDGDNFEGSSRIGFEILDGRPMAAKSDSYTHYYGHGQDRNLEGPMRSEHTTTTYRNDLVNNTRKLLSSQEHSEMTYLLRDPDATHVETTDIRTIYIYDRKGNLQDAYGEGEKSGWEYLDTRSWYHPYASTINIDYKITLGKHLIIEYREDKEYPWQYD